MRLQGDTRGCVYEAMGGVRLRGDGRVRRKGWRGAKEEVEACEGRGGGCAKEEVEGVYEGRGVHVEKRQPCGQLQPIDFRVAKEFFANEHGFYAAPDDGAYQAIEV